MVDLHLVEIDLYAGLNLIASVNKQQRSVFQYQRQPRRAVKARQPGQLCIIRCARFALPGIGARHNHPVELIVL